MAKVSSSIKNELYRVEIATPTCNTLIANEPVDKGGKDAGFSPKELLAAALAACTSATVRMYADHKAWPLEEVKIDIDLEWNNEEKKTSIKRKIDFIGNLSKDQKKRLLVVAHSCPVHKILNNPIEIITTI